MTTKDDNPNIGPAAVSTPAPPTGPSSPSSPDASSPKPAAPLSRSAPVEYPLSANWKNRIVSVLLAPFLLFWGVMLLTAGQDEVDHGGSDGQIPGILLMTLGVVVGLVVPALVIFSSWKKR